MILFEELMLVSPTQQSRKLLNEPILLNVSEFSNPLIPGKVTS